MERLSNYPNESPLIEVKSERQERYEKMLWARHFQSAAAWRIERSFIDTKNFGDNQGWLVNEGSRRIVEASVEPLSFLKTEPPVAAAKDFFSFEDQVCSALQKFFKAKKNPITLFWFGHKPLTI